MDDSSWVWKLGGFAGFFSLLWNIAMERRRAFEKAVEANLAIAIGAIDRCHTAGIEYWTAEGRDENAIMQENAVTRDLALVGTVVQTAVDQGHIKNTRELQAGIVAFRRAVSDGAFQSATKGSEPKRWQRIQDTACKLRIAINTAPRRWIANFLG
jgi:hypothetical protein